MEIYVSMIQYNTENVLLIVFPAFDQCFRHSIYYIENVTHYGQNTHTHTHSRSQWTMI